MNERLYKRIVYFVAFTIVATISIQMYWNIENYKTNKQRLINEVQIALDNGIEAYYADITKNNTIAFIDTDTTKHNDKTRIGNIFKQIKLDSLFKVDKDSFGVNKTNGQISFKSAIDSIDKDSFKISSIQVFKGKPKVDSINRLEGLKTKLVVSFSSDSIDFNKLDDFFTIELNRKKLPVDFGFIHSKQDSIVSVFQTDKKNLYWLSTFSKSTYLPSDEKLELLFSNPTAAILKRSLTGIILSLVLSIAIIFCLLFLLKTISKQKELAEIKNDLISNITHEFKTPIATVSTAIEGIKNFNETNDKEKTNKYLNIGDQQLKKLHQMVEKLLETATLDSDKLILNKEDIDVVTMMRKLVEKYQLLSTDKTVNFTTNISELEITVDAFHFENAIANLVDNALKYGGDTVELNINSMLDKVEISVGDNGNGIDKSQREKIFDKFYRVPTGNRHDVKGFGIGLFYTKKIIEKHEGTIQLLSDTKNTIFKVTL